MLSKQLFHLANAVAVFVCLSAAPVYAQPLDKRTLFTFSGPVSMPGVTLPAGTYLFRVVDPINRNVVQVMNAEGTKTYGLFFSIAAERVDPAPAPEVRFMETAVGTPAAIKTWWYPGDGSGFEFIYPKEQARRLAMGATQPVLTTQAQTTTTDQTNTADLSRVSSTGQETQVAAGAASTPSSPAGDTQQGKIAASSISIVNPTLPPIGGVAASQSAVVQPTRTRLPRTATRMPLVALVGTFALLSGMTLRYSGRRYR